jgi:hypothetical protein
VLGAQRVNRAALPHLRARGKGLLVWVGSSSTRGGTPPFLAPYFAAKAAMDALAVSYSTELARWGIETTIIVPGAFTKGTNHFAHSGKPSDEERVAAYEAGPYAGVADKALKGLASLEPAEADPAEVARGIVRVVDLPFGARPFRVHVDPSQDGAEIVNAVADRMRREMYRNIGLADLLSPRINGWAGPAQRASAGNDPRPDGTRQPIRTKRTGVRRCEIAWGVCPKARRKARRMRSRSPKPVSLATASTGCRPCSSISRAASSLRFSIAWAERQTWPLGGY